MNENRIFRVLGIEPTKDEQKLKLAYYEKLKDTNPEDDPEGFKELREAYEQAVQLANMPAEEEEGKEEKKEKTPVDLWIDRAEDLYHHLSKRVDADAWKELLADDLCVGLDTSAEVAERFLAFAMDAPYFPSEIWKLFDQAFDIRALRSEYLEKFPKDYIDYVIRQIEQDMFIDFSYFEGADDADYDTFIRTFFALKGANDGGDSDEAKKLIEDMEDLFIEHPLFDVERLRHALAVKNMDAVRQYLQRLQEKDYDDSIYIIYYIGEALWELGQKEEAYECFVKMEEKVPNHPASMLGRARYCLYAKKYEEAKEICLDMMEMHGESEEILNILKDSNESLLVEQEERMRTDPTDYDNIFEVGWCYFQNERVDDCMKLLDRVEKSDAYLKEKNEQVIFDYNNLRGRCYLIREQYKEALVYIERWRTALDALQDDGTEKTKKKLSRRGFANYATAMCYYELGKSDEETGTRADAGHMKKAIEYLQKAMQYIPEDHPEEQLGYKERMASCYIELEEYDEAVRLCDSVIEQDENYFPAYLTRQSAKYRQKDAQGVVDDYYRAVEIYPGYEKPYILAAKVFTIFRQYQDAIDVVEKARQAGVESLELELYYLKSLRNMIDCSELQEKVYPVLEELQKKMESDQAGSKGKTNSLLAEFYLETTFYYMDLTQYNIALRYIEKAIETAPREQSYRWTKADILLRMHMTARAMAEYKAIEGYYMDNADFKYDIGMCRLEQEKNGEDTGGKKAVEYLQDAARLNPNHTRVFHELMEIYQDRYNDTYNKEDYDKAVEYATRQIENEESRYYYLCRAFVYYDGYEMDKALADFTEGIRIEPDGVYSYNGAGLIHFLENRYEEAKEMYIKAISCLKNGETYAPYRNLVDNLIAMGAYKEAEEWAERFKQAFPEEIQAFERMADVFIREKKYDEAVKVYQMIWNILLQRHVKAKGNAYTSITKQLAETLGDIADVYYIREDIKNAEQYYKRAARDYPVAAAYANMADFYFDTGNYRKAVSYYKKVLGMVEPSHYNMHNYLMGMAKAYAMMGQKKKARLYFDKVMGYLCKEYGSVEQFVSYPPFAMGRCYSMGIMCYYMEEYEQARHYFTQMTKLKKCRTCTYGACYEMIVGQAILAELDGRKNEARLLHAKALQLEPGMAVSRRKLKEL